MGVGKGEDIDLCLKWEQKRKGEVARKWEIRFVLLKERRKNLIPIFISMGVDLVVASELPTTRSRQLVRNSKSTVHV